MPVPLMHITVFDNGTSSAEEADPVQFSPTQHGPIGLTPVLAQQRSQTKQLFDDLHGSDQSLISNIYACVVKAAARLRTHARGLWLLMATLTDPFMRLSLSLIVCRYLR
jgi:hypothetical protein